MAALPVQKSKAIPRNTKRQPPTAEEHKAPPAEEHKAQTTAPLTIPDRIISWMMKVIASGKDCEESYKVIKAAFRSKFKGKKMDDESIFEEIVAWQRMVIKNHYPKYREVQLSTQSLESLVSSIQNSIETVHQNNAINHNYSFNESSNSSSNPFSNKCSNQCTNQCSNQCSNISIDIPLTIINEQHISSQTMTHSHNHIQNQTINNQTIIYTQLKRFEVVEIQCVSGLSPVSKKQTKKIIKVVIPSTAKITSHAFSSHHDSKKCRHTGGGGCFRFLCMTCKIRETDGWDTVYTAQIIKVKEEMESDGEDDGKDEDDDIDMKKPKPKTKKRKKPIKKVIIDEFEEHMRNTHKLSQIQWLKIQKSLQSKKRKRENDRDVSSISKKMKHTHL